MMMRLKHFLMLAALLLAACGGGESGDQTAAPAVSGADESAAAASSETGDAAVADTAAETPATADTEPPPIPDDQFRMGVSYLRLTPTQPTSSSPDQVEVAEFFWYGCPHCFNFDPYLRKWLMTKPDYVNFVRIPAVWNPLVRMHARMFYTAQQLGKGDEMHEAFFNEIHVNGNMLDSEEKIAAFFGKFGVSQVDFKQAWDSFDVNAKLQRANELARRYDISSVPSIVINGKYTSDGSMAGSYDRLIELINQLAAAEHAAH
jgi:protein dithiol oxidoreductase (disulfide-forming)